jgi:hypothetical protein
MSKLIFFLDGNEIIHVGLMFVENPSKLACAKKKFGADRVVIKSPVGQNVKSERICLARHLMNGNLEPFKKFFPDEDVSVEWRGAIREVKRQPVKFVDKHEAGCPNGFATFVLTQFGWVARLAQA